MKQFGLNESSIVDTASSVSAKSIFITSTETHSVVGKLANTSAGTVTSLQTFTPTSSYTTGAYIDRNSGIPQIASLQTSLRHPHLCSQQHFSFSMFISFFSLSLYILCVSFFIVLKNKANKYIYNNGIHLYFNYICVLTFNHTNISKKE